MDRAVSSSSPVNLIMLYCNGEFGFKSVTLYHDLQSITMNGVISPDSSKTFLVEFNQFQVNNLNPLLKYKIY